MKLLNWVSFLDLDYNEKKVESPGEGSYGYGREPETQNRGNAGEGSNAQIGLDGQPNPQRHHHQPQRGNAIPDQNTFGFIVTHGNIVLVCYAKISILEEKLLTLYD